jgi:ABC-type glutathione transport system ATPase component
MDFLVVSNLSVFYSGAAVVKDLSFTLREGETLGIAGESGCGKSTVAKAILGILPRNAHVSGSIRYKGRELVGLREREFAKLRGREISMVFQDPSAALNPVRKIRHQFYDIFGAGRKDRNAADAEVVHFLTHAHIKNPEEIMDRYPTALSGGMKQRVVIAMAISKMPRLLIADEPTSALDAGIRLQIIEELQALNERLGFGMIYISHNLAELSKVSDSIMVMKNGSVIEHRSTRELFAAPKEEYTRQLIAATE